MSVLHQPVLLEQVIQLLAPQPGQSFCDATAGFGGHAEKVINLIGKNGHAWLFDQDDFAIKSLEEKFFDKSNVKVAQENFSDIGWASDMPKLDMILFDLGVSSYQIDTPKRGFSFRVDGPLDMRMNLAAELTAENIVNSYPQSELANIIYRYGEEKRSRAIAQAIVQARSRSRIVSTAQLAEIVSSVTKGYHKTHPATKTFQALRIAVNDELGNLERVLPKLPDALAPGGRLVIISFHSLEDRLVKNTFRSWAQPEINNFGQSVADAKLKLITKKAVKGEEFDKSNPRARSARARAVVKT